MKIYGNTMSPAVLKVLYCANALEARYEYVALDMMQGDHQSEQYKKIHPAGKVPCLVDGDFTLFESNAICKYLARQSKSEYYPVDIKAQAVVDQWTDFVSIHVQNGMSRVMFNKLIAPMINAPVDQESLKCGWEFLAKYLPVVNNQLARAKYLAGDKLTLADFVLLATIDPAEAIELDLKPYPAIKEWREKLRTQDFYQKVHRFYGEEMASQKA